MNFRTNFKSDTGRKWGETTIHIAIKASHSFPGWLLEAGGSTLVSFDGFGQCLTLTLNTAPHEIKRFEEKGSPYNLIKRVHGYLDGIDVQDYHFVRRGAIPVLSHEVDDLRTDRGEWIDNPFIGPVSGGVSKKIGVFAISCDQCGHSDRFVTTIFTDRADVSSRPTGMAAIFNLDDEVDELPENGETFAVLAHKATRRGYGQACPRCLRSANTAIGNGHVRPPITLDGLDRQTTLNFLSSLFGAYSNWSLVSACNGDGVDFKHKGGGVTTGITVISSPSPTSPIIRFQWRAWYGRTDDGKRVEVKMNNKNSSPNEPDLFYAGIYLDQYPLCQNPYSSYISPHFEKLGALISDDYFKIARDLVGTNRLLKDIERAVIEGVKDERLWAD